jgi:transcriptional regulator with XRE-family HTH domain
MNDEAIDPPSVDADFVELGSASRDIVLHRLSAIRRAKGITRRKMAERLGISVDELRRKEESADISISTLYDWAAKLDVPITELVVEPDECLAPTGLAHSQAARLMKAAARLRDRSRRRSIQRLAQTFVEQLAEILPALEQLGQKNYCRSRSPSQSATAGPRPLPDHFFTRRREPRED